MSSPWKVKVEGGNTAGPDAKQAYYALSLLADPEHGIQLHARYPDEPKDRWEQRTFHGDDLDDMADWVERQTSASGVYYSLNPVSSDLRVWATDEHVLRRRWLLIDLDRKKVQEDKDLSATHEEHEEVRAMALEVQDFLNQQGWSAPLLIDSGNGFHLVYRIDLPNDEPGKKLIKLVLNQLHEVFKADKRAGVGKECHDARRIAKLPGTWARRGPNLPKRPWRMCQLLHAPEEPLVVPVELLKKLAESKAETPTPSTNGKTAHKVWEVRAGSENDLTYARRALEYECGKMFLTQPGELNNQIYRSAAALGNFVPELLDEAEVIDRLIAAARGAGCDNPPKDMDTLRRALEKGKQTPRKIPERNGKHEPESKRPKIQPRIFTLPDLLNTEFPPPVWVVPGLLSEGLTILAGKPKLGKSWLALNLALTITGGGKAFGSMDVAYGDVLYLSLEDRLRRVQDRARKVLNGLKTEASRRLHIAVEWERQDLGGLTDMEEWIKSVEKPVLVIVDVWTKFRPISTAGRSAYDQDYAHINALKTLLDQHGVSGIIVHHCKKGKAEDAIEEVSGTLGQAGATDGTLVLTRARTENDAELFVTGRDVEEQHLALEFDPKGFTWTCHGNAAERTESKLRLAVQDLLKVNAGTPLTVLDIALMLKVPEEKRQYLRNVLSRLASDGLAERSGTGRYKWPVRPTDSFDTVPF